MQSLKMFWFLRLYLSPDCQPPVECLARRCKLPLLQPGRAETEGARMLPESHGRPAQPALCKQEKQGPGSFLSRRIYVQDKGSHYPQGCQACCPGLRPRCHMLSPSPSLLSPFVYGITASWPLLPSLTPPQLPFWTLVSDHCFSEMNLNAHETESPEAAVWELWVLLPLAPHSRPVAKSGPQPCRWGPGALPGFIPGSFGDFP